MGMKKSDYSDTVGLFDKKYPVWESAHQCPANIFMNFLMNLRIASYTPDTRINAQQKFATQGFDLLLIPPIRFG